VLVHCLLVSQNLSPQATALVLSLSKLISAAQYSVAVLGLDWFVHIISEFTSPFRTSRILVRHPHYWPSRQFALGFAICKPQLRWVKTPSRISGPSTHGPWMFRVVSTSHSLPVMSCCLLITHLRPCVIYGIVFHQVFELCRLES
jgi:hypothetical protein